MNKKHTPEPWHYCDGGIFSDNHEGIAQVHNCGMNGKYSQKGWENARRIVACVNACAGMPDPEKDIAALKKELVAPIIVQTNRLVDSVADLTAQRDELLAALKECIYCSEHFGKAYAGRDARDKAKALIKRIDHA